MEKHYLKLCAFALAALSSAVLLSCSKPISGQDPDKDPDEGDVPVEEVVLNTSSADIEIGETLQLTATVLPENATDKSVIWTSDNEAVATVATDGTVTGVAEGQATITAAAGEKSASCAITVSSGEISIPENILPGDFLLADGSILPKDTDEATVKAANVIGIVFTADPERISEYDKTFFSEKGMEVRGYAMALKDAGDRSVQWYTDVNTTAYYRDETEIGIPNIIAEGDHAATFDMADNDLDGHKYQQLIMSERKDDFDAGSYPVFKAAYDYGSEVPAPDNTTGWFVPSNGQIFDILRNLGAVTLDTATNFIPENNEDFLFVEMGAYVGNINNTMGKVDEADKSNIGSSVMYWSSSAASPTDARYVYVDNSGLMICMHSYKSDVNRVRPVIAFGYNEK